MTDETGQKVRFLAAEIIEALGAVLQKRKPLDSKTLSESLLERPSVVSLFKETAAEETDLGEELEKKNREFKDLSAKYNQTLKDLQYTEVQAREIEESLKELALILTIFAKNDDEPALEKELETLKDTLKKHTVPSRIINTTKELKNLLFKIDAGALEEFPEDKAVEAAGPEDVEDNIRDILAALVGEIASFEDPNLQEQAQDLALRIGSDFTLDNFEPFVHEIFNLIFQIKELMRHKREELYRFSQEVMVHLEETEKALVKTLDSDRDRFMILEVDFEMRVHEDMQEIEQSFKMRGKSLDEIRTAVLNRIGSIRRHFLEKKADDEARIKQIEKEKKSVQKRLKSGHRRYQDFTRQSKTAFEEM
ncbi:MAG: hypothetical protein JRI54_09105, partial [Deltaproteobacteria bacterium]|nr:hypothetical protein [Deltaproteobacteria bacterium]